MCSTLVASTSPTARYLRRFKQTSIRTDRSHRKEEVGGLKSYCTYTLDFAKMHRVCCKIKKDSRRGYKSNDVNHSARIVSEIFFYRETNFRRIKNLTRDQMVQKARKINTDIWLFIMQVPQYIYRRLFRFVCSSLSRTTRKLILFKDFSWRCWISEYKSPLCRENNAPLWVLLFARNYCNYFTIAKQIGWNYFITNLD